MSIVYSVGLYCKYEGGSPFIFFNTKEEANKLVELLIRYSNACNKHSDSDEIFSIFDISNAFFEQYPELTYKGSLPYYFDASTSEYRVVEHVVVELKESAITCLNQISNYE